jgi:hypothetical protein
MNVSCAPFALVSALLASLALGCGESGPQIVPVRGTATRGGKPVANLYLDFQSANGRNSWAFTDEQGRYELEYDQGVMGAIVGEHTVTVLLKPKDLEAELALQTGQFKWSADAQKIAAKYGAGSPNRKKVSVAPGSEVIDLELD